MFSKVLFIFVIHIVCAYAEYACETPNGEIGVCIVITSCVPIMNVINSKHAIGFQHARNSHCGFQGIVPMVCCGTMELEDIESPMIDIPNMSKNENDNENLNGEEIRNIFGISANEAPVRNTGEIETSTSEDEHISIVFGAEYACKIPNGEVGVCIVITSCVPIMNAINTKGANGFQLARNSHCGFQDIMPMVCCGTMELEYTESPTIDIPNTSKNENDNDNISRSIKHDGGDIRNIFGISASEGPIGKTDETETSTSEYEYIKNIFGISPNGNENEVPDDSYDDDDDNLRNIFPVKPSVPDLNITDIIDIIRGDYKGEPKTTTETIEESTPLFLKDFDTAFLPDRTLCGIHFNEDRIYGGEKTSPDEFPWLAALEYRNNATDELIGVRCGGSIINRKFILTAAHCLYHPGWKLTHVRVGEWNLTSDPDCPDCLPVQIFKIEKKIPHLFYGGEHRTNDIALLKLEKFIAYNEYIRPICLPPVNLPAPTEGVKLTVAGWGATENGNTLSDVKMKVEVPVMLNDKCAKALGEVIQPSKMCAGGEPGKDACQGDSGGPLFRHFVDQVAGRYQWFQDAIVSRGIECGATGRPGIYTRISRYFSWIRYNIESN